MLYKDKMLLKRRFLLNFFARNFKNHRARNEAKENVSSATDFLWKSIETNNIKSAQDWRSLRNYILSSTHSITPLNIDAITVSVCTSKKEYQLALSYVDFLQKENIPLNLATLGKYLKLLYLKGINGEAGPDNEERILTLYDTVRKSYPVLDALTLESVIQALSVTKKWKMCFELLNEAKLTAPPGSFAYSAAISAAFSNDYNDVAWQLCNESLENDRIILPTVYYSYFKKVAAINEKLHRIKEAEKMFNFFQKNSIKINGETIDDFADHLKAFNATVERSIINQSGVCKCCKNKLQAFDLSENEFNDLKNKIFQNIIIGKDVFNKTTPAEVQRFKQFISNMEHYDVVIDGLNVAYSVGVKQSPLVISGLVASVVSYFVSVNKKVLVLGRSHMNNWPKQNWAYVQQNSTQFLTQDLSQDDPYLLYCALNSGKDTIIVTKDLMRSHKFLLKNAHLKVLFDRWLSQRQYQLMYVQKGGTPVFKKPSSFSNVAQKNREFWHVPFSSTRTSVHNTSIHNTWLCIKF